MLRLSCVLLSLLTLTSCSTAIKIYSEGRESVLQSYLFTTASSNRGSQWVLARETVFYVARNSELTVLNSLNSSSLTDALTEAVSFNFSYPLVGMLSESREQALKSADRLGADFVVYPSIVTWEDKVGNWTELFSTLRDQSNDEIVRKIGLDKAQVQLMIVHTSTGDVFDVVRIDASSGVFSLYGDKPASILASELRTFFANLVAATG